MFLCLLRAYSKSNGQKRRKKEASKKRGRDSRLVQPAADKQPR